MSASNLAETQTDTTLTHPQQPIGQQAPLSHQRFYILLALAKSSLHGYALQGAVHNLSKGTLQIETGNLYPILARMTKEGFIQPIKPENNPDQIHSSSRTRLPYRITEYGLLTLKADLTRIQHAIRVADRANLLDDEVPLEIQQLLQALK